MSSLLLGARLVLALLFAVAGIAKLCDLAGSRGALVEFGVPPALAKPVGTLLPFVELAAGLALLPTPTARFGALVALALLTSFALAIGAALFRGQEPECHCFGQLHSAVAGWRTLIRNLALMALAAFVVAAGWSDPGASATSWIARLDLTQAVGLPLAVLTSAALGFLGWFSLQLLRQNGRLLARVDALEARVGVVRTNVDTNGRARSGHAGGGLLVGSRAPDFSLRDTTGGRHSLESLLRLDRPLMIVFSDPDCGPCTALLPEIAEWQREHGLDLTIALVSRGARAQTRAKAEEHGIVNVLSDGDRDVFNRYRATGTPSAVLVDRNGRLASSLAEGPQAIRGLLSTFLMDNLAHDGAASKSDLGSHPQPVSVGEAAPDFALRDLRGEVWSLAGLRDQLTLLVFWNPRCGFCRQILDEIRSWEARRTDSDPRLVLISTGSVEENRAQDLRSPVLLDHGLVVGAAFGVTGTPSAALIDSASRLASPLAVGAPDVLALTREHASLPVARSVGHGSAA